MALAHVFRAIRLSPLVLMLAGALPLAASAADSTWTSTTDGNWNNSANWSGNDSPCFDAGGPNFGYDGGAFFTVPGTQKNTSVSGPCLINHAVFGVSDGWVVDGYNGVLFSSSSLAGYGPPSTLQADADVVFNSIVSYNGGLTIFGAGDVSFNETGNGFDGFGTVTINGPGTTTIANLVDANTGDPSPVIVNGGTLIASPATGSHDLTINAPGSVTTSAAAWRSISGSGNLTLAGGTTSVAVPSTFAGNISGAGALQKNGSGTLVLTGTNTWSGGTTIAQGTLQIGDGVSGTYPGFALANNGLLVMNATGLSTIQTYVGTGDIVIQGGFVVTGPSLNLGSGLLIVNGGGLSSPAVSSNSVVTVNAPGLWIVGNSSVGSLAGNGAISLAPSPVQIGLDNSDRSFSGTISGTGTLTKIGAGKQTFGDIASTGVITVNSGAIELNGSTVSAPITINGGTLLGKGTVNAPVMVAPAGAIRSAVPGSITSGNLTASGTVQVQIDGTTPSVGYGQILANGTVTLNSATLQLSGSYTPVVGDVFAVIVNDGADAVSGTFNGLPEGATVMINGVGLHLSYMGGTGNDVVLTVGTKQVTPSVAGNGTINPGTPVTVAEGATTTFTLTPAANNHFVSIGGTCPAGAAPSGATYTTGAITGDCSVIANFAIDTRALTVNKLGNGTGTLTSSPAGINCGSTCSAPFDHGTPVTLTNTPGVGSTFAGWSGACTGTGACIVTMDAAKSVTATFTLVSRTLTVSKLGNGTGTLTSSPAGINCGSTCNAPFDHGTPVTLTNTPGVGSTFAGWSGACTGTGACIVTMDAAKSVTATFTLVSRTLTVNKLGNGTGTLTSSPAGINCGSTCNAPFDHGTPVTLTNTPGVGSTFAGWSGACTGTGACIVTMDAAKSVTATFTLDSHLLTVSTTGSGTITSSPAGIACGATCSFSFNHGTPVTLTATPDAGFALQAWGGACTGSGPFTCMVTVDAAKTVSATFVSLGSDLGTTITATPNPAVAGQDVTFTLTVSSAGPEAGDGVATWAFIPSGATFVSASAGCTQSTLGPNPIVLCTPNTLAIGATAQYTFVLRRATAGTLTVNANVSSSKPDPVAANNNSSVSVTVDPATRLGNISTRMRVGTGNDVLIGGFIIGGSSNKKVAIVATGPSLAAYGITNPLAHPTLTLVRQSDQTVIASNDGWQNAANAAQLTAAGFAPSDLLESAILIDLAPGAYTAIVSGSGNGTGVGVVAVYEVDHPELPLVNISTRGQVLTGNDVMIGGFIINGTASKTLAIVATGPSLTQYGITNALANPTLTLVRSSDQAVLATNDDWQTTANVAQLQAAGFAPSNPLESAIFITLPPGAYTAILSGAGGGTGVGIIGVYATD